MTTTKEVSIETMRPLGLHVGDTLQVIEEKEASAVIEIVHAASPLKGVKRRGSAGAWARSAQGIASMEPNETRDDARMAYYREKYGLQ